MPLQATSGAASYDAFGGGVPVVPAYIEEVFSTWLWTNDDATSNPIVNGIDLSTKGGLVWMKGRTRSDLDHILYDTARGTTSALSSNTTGAQTAGFGNITYNTNGFTKGSGGGNDSYVGWTFRKQPKFFDVVTYTGNGTSGRSVAHNLGSAPGCIIVKRTSASNDWRVYHRSMGSPAQNFFMSLNTTQATFDTSVATMWTAAPTSTEFFVSDQNEVNANGQTYVAYLFAHDAGGFGLTGTDNVISCGSYTVDSVQTQVTVNVGYEPQWLLIKRATGGAGAWYLFDNMRGITTGGDDNQLQANSAGSEAALNPLDAINLTSTGFETGTSGGVKQPSSDYIYIAIRRGPMKVPTDATKVFTPIARAGTSAVATVTAGFPVDMTIIQDRTQNSYGTPFDRLRGATNRFFTSLNLAEASEATSLTGFDVQTGFTLGTDVGFGAVNTSGDNYINWNFRRAPSFFDVVCYTGTGVNRTVSHNLGVAPELMIVKKRSSASTTAWFVYCAYVDVPNQAAYWLGLNTTAAADAYTPAWNATNPTASVFTVGTDTDVNASGATFVAYLFGTCAGVSKVFSYTGNGSSQTINCGFTGGARFVMIKRTDSTGDWYVWDTARGIVAGNDPHLSLNTTAAEVTSDDTIDTDSTGFVVNQVAATGVNVSSATYIGLAIA